jgi:hypothetical protein
MEAQKDQQAQNNFALTLFTWIRKSKKELYSLVPPDTFLIEDAGQKYLGLRNRIAHFEMTCRGAQHWLRGERCESHYFALSADNEAVEILVRVMDVQSLLLLPSTTPFGRLWQSFFELPGMPAAIFKSFAFNHVNNNRLPYFLKDYTGVRANLIVGYRATPQLKVIIRNGEAVNTLTTEMLLPDVHSLTLGEQVRALNRYWVLVKEKAQQLLKDRANWPSYAESIAIESDEVREIARSFVSNLEDKERNLLRKYPNEFKKFLTQLL